MFQTSFSQCARARLSVTLQGTPAWRNRRGDVVRARFGRALEFAQHDHAVADVVDDARLDAVQADEAEAAQDLFGRERAAPVAPRCPVRFAA